MKKILLLLIIIMGLLTSCEEGHRPYKYKVQILRKWQDNGAAFLCFGSETKYHMTFRFYNDADSVPVWIYPGHKVTNPDMYFKYEVGTTYTITQDSPDDVYYFLCSNYDQDHHHDYYNPLKKGKGKRKRLKPEYEL